MNSSGVSILSGKQIQDILRERLGEGRWEVSGYEQRSAAEGLSGFLGDHFRVTINAKLKDVKRTVQLFVKTLPSHNEPKAKWIDELHYNRREMLVFKLFEQLGGAEGPNPWRTKAYVYTDRLLVMPDMSFEGYTTRSYYEELDLNHVFLTIQSLARFHAAFANYETKRIQDDKVTLGFFHQHEEVLKEPAFGDTPFITAAAKLTGALLHEFSTKPYLDIPQSKLREQFVKACESLKIYEETLNVLLHKDLWVKNIMFKYENGIPNNAILIDFQCIRYGPPAFDIMVLLHLNTSKDFRDSHEKTVIRHYYEWFTKELSACTKKRLQQLGYNWQCLVEWCQRARMFGMLEAMVIFPFVLMEPTAAQRTFDDPDTYSKYIEDRDEPVLEQARLCDIYKNRQVNVSQEFIDRYIFRSVVSEDAVEWSKEI